MTGQSHAVTSGTVPLEDGHLFYESAGRGPAVVLLHGGVLDVRMWDEQFLPLADQGHRVIRFDARGHGRSSTVAGDYAPHDDLRALLTRLDVPSAALVGLSLGARTALDAALAHPGLVSSLVLASPGISGRTFTDPYVLHHTEQQIAAIGAPDAARKFVEHFLRMWVDGPHREESDVDRVLRARMSSSAAQNVARHAAGLGAGVPQEVGAAGRLGEVSVPVLVLHGELDSSDISGAARDIADAVPGARHVLVPGAAHMVNLENTALFDRELSAFLTTPSR